MTPFRDSCWLAGPVLLSYVTHLYCSYVAWKELFPFRQFLGSFSSGVPMQPIPNEDFYSPNTHYQLCLEKGPESCPTACTSPPPPPPHCLLGQQRDAGTSSPPRSQVLQAQAITHTPVYVHEEHLSPALRGTWGRPRRTAERSGKLRYQHFRLHTTSGLSPYFTSSAQPQAV